MRSTGPPAYPVKVVLTRRGGLSRDFESWHYGDREIVRLLLEGDGTVHPQFLTAGVVAELHQACAPLFVGQDAPASSVPVTSLS